MPRLFYGNFDFEEQLHAAPGQQRSAAVERLVGELVFGFLGVATPEDRIWCPGRVPDAFLDAMESIGIPREILVHEASRLPRGLTLEPWGWSEQVVDFGQRHGLVVDPPPLDVVRLANSREFSVGQEDRLEREQGEQESPTFCLCRTLGEVLAFSEPLSPTTRWVIKANWSHAARERILVRGPLLDHGSIAWVKQRLARDGVVCCEFWLDRIREFGIQWHIPKNSEPEIVAITELLVDSRGQYLGTRCIDPLTADVRSIAEATRHAVEELAQRGYHGPLGIDAMLYRDSHYGYERVRPLQDINARWTMGRLAVGWFRKALSGSPLPPAEGLGVRAEWQNDVRSDSQPTPPSRSLTWIHGSEETARALDPTAQLIATSPDQWDERPVGHRSWMAING